MIGPAEPFIAFAIILSAIVSIVGTSARKRAVEEGRARAADLCELTGIFDPRTLQDVFGPPTLQGTFLVNMKQVVKARMPLGHLLSDDRIDIACILVAIASFLTNHFVTDVFLVAAAAIQTASWFISSGLPEASSN